MNTHKHLPFLKGFSIIETMMVVGTLSLITTMMMPMYRKYMIRNDLGNAVAVITQGLDRARVLSQASKEDSDWGFSAAEGVLFKGTDYATSDPTSHLSFPIPSSVTVSGTTEVWFAKGTGAPNAAGSVIILTADDGEQREINLELDSVGSPVNLSDLVMVCHHPNGPNPTTMYIQDSAVSAHIGHGDTQGACPSQSSSSSSSNSSSAASSSSSSSSQSSASSSSSSSAPASSSSSSSAGGGGSSSSGVPALTTKGVYLLDSSAPNALNVSGNAQLTVANTGIVQVNSTNGAAAALSGNARVTSDDIYVSGNPGTSVSGNAAFVGTVHSGATPVADPLASLAVPTAGTQLPAVSVSGNSVTTLNPNTYAGISASGNAQLTLNPGVYYVNGNVSISGNAQITGTNVIIYVTNGTFSLAGNGAVSLTPPYSGTYAGVTLFINRASTGNVSISGNGQLNIQGTLYGADSTFVLSGNGAGNVLGSLVIGKKLSMSGNATFRIQDQFSPSVLRIDDNGIAAGYPNQHSMVRSITLTLATPTTSSSLPALVAGFAISRTGGQTGTLSLTGTLNGAGTQLTLQFSGTSVLGGSLADGRYTLTFNGTTLLTDSQLFRVFGDINGDAQVDATDETVFLTALGSASGNAAYKAWFDFHTNGNVNNADRALFYNTNRWMMRLDTNGTMVAI